MKIDLVPILADNYVFVIHQAGQAFVVDPGEAPPVADFLRHQGLELVGILVTHRHGDHIAGVPGLMNDWPQAQVWGPDFLIERWGRRGHAVDEGDSVDVLGENAKVWRLPGHVPEHRSYHLATSRALFSGDVLFGLGCGRNFEGPVDEMWTSLQRIAALPDDTRVFATHEYTERNLDFLNGRPEATPELKSYADRLRELRAQAKPSIPLRLGDEKRCNPFLRAHDSRAFVQLRAERNRF